jgi:hypothetical protein
MSIFGKIFDVVGDFGSNIYNAGKSAVSGVGGAVSDIFSSGVVKGAGNVLSNISGPVGTVGTLIGGASAISNLVSDKDSGQGSPLGAFTGLQGAPSPVANTTGTGTGTGGLVPRFDPTFGSGQSFVPNAPLENQSGLVETSQSSLGNLVPFALPTAQKAFQIAQPFVSNKASQAIGLLGGLAGALIGDDKEQTTTTNNITTFAPTIGDPMAFGIGGQGALTIPQAMPMQGTAFMSPVLGRIGISSKGNIIITRRLKNQFKALADNVGLAQASNLAGVPLEIGAMILTKRFATRGKSISTKKMQECARTYKRITNFYNMIPRRTATRTTRAKTMRGASTVIQNS